MEMDLGPGAGGGRGINDDGRAFAYYTLRQHNDNPYGTVVLIMFSYFFMLDDSGHI